MAKPTHTPGPWAIDPDVPLKTGFAVMAGKYGIAKVWDHEIGRSAEHEANARLIAAAPDLLNALIAVRHLIAEVAATGFNHEDGDWPERLFLSQQSTSAALRKAGAR